MTDLITIFCEIDDFCKDFVKQVEAKKNLLSDGEAKRKRPFSLTPSEVMTISIWYHFSGYRTFQDYYTKEVERHLSGEFPTLVSYNRFIELRKKIVTLLFIFFVTRKLSNCTGISYIDSFKLEACHIKREKSHKTLKKIAQKGKTSTGWFYGMKVHLVINQKGEIISFHISSGNFADNDEFILFKITKNLIGKLFGDKGYLINQVKANHFLKKSLQLITKVRDNMKEKTLSAEDKFYLEKRGIIESVGDILKEHLLMQHTRHRSMWGFLLHVFTSLISYQMRPNKPQLSQLYEPQLATS